MRLAGGHRLRPCLHDEQLAVLTVLGPLDVHRHQVPGLGRIVLLDLDRVASQLEHVGVVQAVADTVGTRGFDVGGGQAAAGLRVDHLQLLFATRTAQHTAEALAIGGLVNIPLVGVHLALHHVLAQAVGAGDEDHVLEAGLGVQREDHTAGSLVTADHAHYADRQQNLEMIKATVHAIRNGAVGENGREAAPAGIEHGVTAADVQIAVVLAGETGSRQVLGGGGTAHGHGDAFARFFLEITIGGHDLLLQIVIGGRLIDDFAALLCDFAEGFDVGLVQAVQNGMQLGPCAGCFE